MGATPWPYTLNAWTQRAPAVADGTAAAGPYVSVTVPKWDRLWDNMQADGDDLRWCGYSGTALTFENAAPDTSARTIGTHNVAYTSAGASKVDILWMYWGNAAASNGEGAPTKTTLGTTRFGGYPDPARTILCVPDPPGATVPAQRFAKKQDEACMLWWDMTPALGDAEPVAGRPSSAFYLKYIDVNTTDGSGIYSAETTSEDTWSSVYFDICEIDGRLYVGMSLLATYGTSGTDYTVKFRVGLESVNGLGGTVGEYRCLMQLRDTAP